jgi:hypothetical protein
MTQEASGGEWFCSQQQLLQQQLYRRDQKFQTFLLAKLLQKAKLNIRKSENGVLS